MATLHLATLEEKTFLTIEIPIIKCGAGILDFFFTVIKEYFANAMIMEAVEILFRCVKSDGQDA